MPCRPEEYYQGYRATSQKLRYADTQIPSLELIMEGHNPFSAEERFELISQHALSADVLTKRGAQNRILAVAGKLPTRSVHKTKEQIQHGQAQCPFCNDNETDDQEHFLKCTGSALPALEEELRYLKEGYHLSMIANMHKWEIPGMERSTTPPFPSVPWAEEVSNNRNISARRGTLQEKDTKKGTRLGEDLRKQVVEFADKSAARADKE